MSIPERLDATRIRLRAIDADLATVQRAAPTLLAHIRLAGARALVDDAARLLDRTVAEFAPVVEHAPLEFRA